MKKIFLMTILFILIFNLTGCGKKETQPQNSRIPGVTDTEIILGSSSALTGHAGHLGINYIHGALSRINDINNEGGIHGRKIRVISYDDQYDPPKCIKNTQKLINEDKVFALFNYVGTPTSVKVIPIVEEAKIPLVGLLTGAHTLREPLRKYIFNIRGSYYQETELAVEHFVEHLGLKRIAVFYQADSYGLDGLEGVKIALRKYGLKPEVEGTYVRGTMDVEEAVEKITKSEAQAVIMIGTYSPSAKFVRLAKQKKPDLQFHSVSFVGPEQFLKELGEYGENVAVTQVVPPPTETELLEGVEAFRKSLKRYYPDEEPTFGGLEGYVNAKVLIEGLRRAGKDLTREKLLDALESIKSYSVGIGAEINFDKDDHQGMERIYLTRIKDGNFRLHNKAMDEDALRQLRKNYSELKK